MKESARESIIGIVMSYFYGGGGSIKTDGLYDVLSSERPWLTLQQVRTSVSDILKRSPGTLLRGAGNARVGYYYTYTGVRYNPSIRSEKITVAEKTAIREAEKPMRARLISEKW